MGAVTTSFRMDIPSGIEVGADGAADVTGTAGAVVEVGADCVAVVAGANVVGARFDGAAVGSNVEGAAVVFGGGGTRDRDCERDLDAGNVWDVLEVREHATGACVSHAHVFGITTRCFSLHWLTYVPAADADDESRTLAEATDVKLVYRTEKVQPACRVLVSPFTPPVIALYVFPSKRMELPEAAVKVVSCLRGRPPLPVTELLRNQKVLFADNTTAWLVYEVDTM